MLFRQGAGSNSYQGGHSRKEASFFSPMGSADFPGYVSRRHFFPRVASHARTAECIHQRAIQALGRRSPTMKSSTTAEAEAASESASTSQDTRSSGKAVGGPLGYTPFEYVTFGDNQLTHELSIEVNFALLVVVLHRQLQKRQIGDCIKGLQI